MSWFKKEPEVVTVISNVSGSEPRPVDESRDSDRAYQKLENAARNNPGQTYQAEEYIDYPADWLRDNAKRR